MGACADSERDRRHEFPQLKADVAARCYQRTARTVPSVLTHDLMRWTTLLPINGGACRTRHGTCTIAPRCTISEAEMKKR